MIWAGLTKVAINVHSLDVYGIKMMFYYKMTFEMSSQTAIEAIHIQAGSFLLDAEFPKERRQRLLEKSMPSLRNSLKCRKPSRQKGERQESIGSMARMINKNTCKHYLKTPRQKSIQSQMPP